MLKLLWVLNFRFLNLPAEKEAIGPQGKSNGKYGDFTKESQLVASLIIDVFAEESTNKPLLSPRLVIKINNDALVDENAKSVLLKAHQLAAKSGIPYFANMTKKESENVAFSSSGVKFAADLTGDWETDTLRTGCLGCVTINLPRIALECEKDKNKFYDLMRERFELAARALSIKNNALKQFGKTSLPFLLQKAGGDTYFRLENCSRIINLAGLPRSHRSLHREKRELGREPQICRRDNPESFSFQAENRQKIWQTPLPSHTWQLRSI